MRAVNLIAGERSAGTTGGRSKGAAAMVLGLFAALALLAGLYGMAKSQLSTRRQEAAVLRAQAEGAQQQATQLSSYTRFAQLRDQRVRDVSELIASRFDWANALSELGRVLPAGAVIATVNGSIAPGAAPATPPPTATPPPASTTGTTTTPPASTTGAAAAPPVTSATPPGSVPTFAITGCANTQAEVARALYRLRLIAGVADVQLLSSARASSSSGSSSGLCASGGPSFSETVSFDPLPSSPAAAPPSSGSPSVASSHSEAAAVAKAKAAIASAPASSSGVSP